MCSHECWFSGRFEVLCVFYWWLFVDSKLYTWLSRNRKPSQSSFDLVENQMGLNAKWCRCGNRRKYVLIEFVDRSCGILIEQAMPYSQQQNGVAERINHTLKETERSVLYCSGILFSVWTEKVSTAVYFLNKIPTVQL